LRPAIRYAVATVGTGIFLSLLTGLYNNTPQGLVGASRYGFPFTWLSDMVVAPQYFPWNVDVASLFYDMAFWIALAGIILYIIMRPRFHDNSNASNQTYQVK
jgi:hypothetical protein